MASSVPSSDTQSLQRLIEDLQNKISFFALPRGDPNAPPNRMPAYIIGQLAFYRAATQLDLPLLELYRSLNDGAVRVETSSVTLLPQCFLESIRHITVKITLSAIFWAWDGSGTFDVSLDLEDAGYGYLEELRYIDWEDFSTLFPQLESLKISHEIGRASDAEEQDYMSEKYKDGIILDPNSLNVGTLQDVLEELLENKPHSFINEISIESANDERGLDSDRILGLLKSGSPALATRIRSPEDEEDGQRDDRQNGLNAVGGRPDLDR